MRHVDRGCAQFAREQGDLAAERIPQPGVQIGQGLVKQDQAWTIHNGPRQRHALLLAAGQFARKLVRESPHLDPAQSSLDQFWPFGQRVAPCIQWKADIIAHPQMRPQSIILKHHAKPAPLGRREDFLRRRRNQLVANADRARVDIKKASYSP